MKTTMLSSFPLLILVSFFSCKSNQTVSKSPEGTNGTNVSVTSEMSADTLNTTTTNMPKAPGGETPDSLKCKLPVQDEDRFNNGSSDPFTLIGAKINGNNLEVEVEYGGGCGGAEFELVWNGALMKSMPPKVAMVVLLKDEDYCKALVRKTICFDIHKIYNGEFVLMLKGYDGELRYSPR